MNFFRFGFVSGMAAPVVISLLGDPATYRPGTLRRSWRKFRRSPIMSAGRLGPAQGLQPPRLPPRRQRHDRIGRTLAGRAVRRARHPERQADRSRDLMPLGAETDTISTTSTSSSSAPASRGSAPATTCSPSARGPPTPSSRRATRSAAPGICSATRGSVPTRTCSRSGTRSGPGTARSRSPTATRSSSTSRTPQPSPVSTRTSASTTASPRRLVHADARWHVTAERTDTGETLQLTAGFLFSCSGYYRYDRGYLPDFAGMDDFAGTSCTPRPGPRTSTSAASGSWSSGAGPPRSRWSPRWRDGRPRDHAPALAELHRLAARAEPGGRRCREGPARPAGRDGRQVVPRPADPGLLLSEPPVPRVRQADAAQGPRAQSPARLRHRHPLHPPLQPVGPAVLRRARRRPLPGHQRRHGFGRHRPHRALHRTGPAADLRDRARGGHHRDRHRARAALPRRHRTAASTAMRRPGDPPHLQGHDDRGRAQPGRRHRVRQRVVDAQVRPHLRLRVPPAQPHAPSGV